MRTLVWFRGKDLRLSDHIPLREAIQGGEVVPLFVVDPFFFSAEKAQKMPHRMHFMRESVEALERNIASKGSRLICLSGRSVDLLPRLVKRWKIDRVVAYRWSEPFGRKRDRLIAERLGVPFDLFEGETLAPPGVVRTLGGTPYAVFTPFARALRAQAVIGRAPGAPRAIPPLPKDIKTAGTKIPSLKDLGLRENKNLLTGGEAAARLRLKAFLSTKDDPYIGARDRMDWQGTSRLSQDLKFGTLSVREVWNRAQEKCSPQTWKVFSNQLLWREFAYHTLWDRPELWNKPFKNKWVGFPWQKDRRLWAAWSQGMTGYPIVDAAARQLLHQGYVHNRARMIAASFLTKHLLLDYRLGEAHYLKYLVDGDWALNNMGWQWSAGCGCDAQPYFRIFNPITQGKRFDPDGIYIRQWIPELESLPQRFIHEPWKGVEHFRDKKSEAYPKPIVDHREARLRFLSVAKEFLQNGSP